ncbi:MAG: hypothetical protein P8J28_04410, partial [Polaribacter sp.]|nr:hypothetical protein [Polaribacter sp.]
MILNHTKKAAIFSLLFMFVFTLNSTAQDKLKQMPGYTQYKKMSPQLFSSVKRAPTSVTWAKDGKTFTYVENGMQHTYD